MHTYHYTAYIDSSIGFCFYTFNHYGIGEVFIRLYRKCTARMRLRDYIYLFKAILLHGLPFNYNRSVEMLAALRGEEHPGGFQHRLGSVEQVGRHLHGRVGADLLAEHLAGRAPDDEDVAGGQPCRPEDFAHCLRRLLCDKVKIL